MEENSKSDRWKKTRYYCKKYFYVLIAIWNLLSILLGNIIIFETTSTKNEKYCLGKLLCNKYFYIAVFFVVVVALASNAKEKYSEDNTITLVRGNEKGRAHRPDGEALVPVSSMLNPQTQEDSPVKKPKKESEPEQLEKEVDADDKEGKGGTENGEKG